MRGFVLAILTVVIGCTTPTPTSSQPTLVGSPGVEPTKKSGLLWYLIHFDETNQRMHVRVRLSAPHPRTKFYLPDRWAGRDDWATRISIDGVEGPDGPRLFTIDRNQGIVEADGRAQPWVELAYQVSLAPGPRLFPQLEDGNVAAFAPTFAVLPSAQVLAGLSTIPIEIHASQTWDVAATWRLERHASSKQEPDRAVWGFVADSAAQLNDAFLMAGPKLAITETDHLRIVTPRGFHQSAEPLFDAADRVLRDYNSRFGNIGRATMFVRPRRPDEHTEFVGMGRRGGFVVDIDPSTESVDEMKLLIAHEAFHLWNGHWVVPSSAQEAQTRWFKEGITHYIALKSLAKLGLLTEGFVLEELARTGTAYQTNRIVRGGEPTPSDVARYPYQVGTLLGLQLDALLQKSGSNVEDWFATLSTAPSATAAGYDVSLLKSTLDTVSAGSPPVRELWKEHVQRNQIFDLRDVYQAADLHWLPPRLNEPAKLVALDRPNPVYRRLWKRNEQR